MGFTISDKIKTVLTYQDIALIGGAMFGYQNQCGDDPNNQEQKQHSINLVNRLGHEMAAYPNNDFTTDGGGKPLVEDNALKLLTEMRGMLEKIWESSNEMLEETVSSRYMGELIEDVNVYLANRK